MDNSLLPGSTALSEAIEGNLAALLCYCTRVPDALLRHNPEVTAISTGLKSSFFNAVVSTHLGEHGLDEAIDSILAPFQERGVPLLWWVWPSSRPADPGPFLMARNFVYRGEGPGMTANLSTVPTNLALPADVEIEQVRDEETLKLWLQLGEEGRAPLDQDYLDFELALGLQEGAPYRRYLARYNGLPVAGSLLFLDADAAGLYGVVTLPEARGKGIGTAVSLMPLLDAWSLGYQVAVLESSPDGFPVYTKLGFRECCRVKSYIWRPA
jgi:GNAT superfamily N-acetyltransferase